MALTLLNTIINWEKISARLCELSQDESKIERVVEEQMIKIIKAKHPANYQKFMKIHEKKLKKIKERLKNKYSNELKTRFLAKS